MIAIARVMLKNPNLVILDEATSNIDTSSLVSSVSGIGLLSICMHSSPTFMGLIFFFRIEFSFLVYEIEL